MTAQNVLHLQKWEVGSYIRGGSIYGVSSRIGDCLEKKSLRHIIVAVQ